MPAHLLCLTVSVSVMSAGDGYKYPLATVAAGDGDHSLSTPLTKLILDFSVTTHQRFAHARLPGPHLTHHPVPSQPLTTTVINQRSMRWSDASPRRATPKGRQSFISCTAPHRETLPT